jgi:alpha-beta hydrolase superfamily lysophospholipase
MNLRTDDALISSPPPKLRPVQRIAILLAAALLIQVAFGLLPFLGVYGRSERFHTMVPCLWLVDFLIYGRQHSPRWAYGAIACAGVAFLLSFSFWSVLSTQAKDAGGTADWREVLYKLYLMASMFVLYTVLSRCLSWILQNVPPTRKLMTTPHRRWLQFLRAVVALGLFAPYLFTANNIHRFKIGNGATPKSANGLAYEDVRLLSARDGIPLSAWFIPAPNSKKVVVVCHGLGANKSIYLGVTPFLHHAGFNILMLDLRGHGSSGGHTISIGRDEAYDVQGAVHYLQRQRGFTSIALYGFSMGGAAVMHAAHRLPDVDTVVVDSTFAEFPPLVKQQLSWLPAPLDKAMLAATAFYTRLELGSSLEDVSPRPFIPAISPRPMFIIHGTADSLIPAVQARAIYSAAREPKQLWLVEGADHCRCRSVGVQEYESRVARFLRRTLQ